LGEVLWRAEPQRADIAAVRALVGGAGMFTPAEVAIAGELVEERLAKGAASDYDFVFAEADGELLGYACYGLTPGADIAWDLYWIAVARDRQGCGLGRAILAQVEADVARRGGRALYADTSGTPAYAPTRAFYERAGFAKVVELEDFYRAGDAKVIYRMAVSAA
jgi:ribosomal protein S18 acetylase RimI-like enzyme